MNLGKVILIGTVSKIPTVFNGNTKVYTFEISVHEEPKFQSTFNIQCSEETLLSLKESLGLNDVLYIEGRLRGQALKRRKLTNQTLTIVFAKLIKLIQK